MDGMTANVASSATGNAALGLGIAGTALGVLNGGIGNILGGNWGYGNGNGSCSENTFVNRYELNMTRESDSLKAENALLRSQVYVDQKLVDVVKDYTGQINALATEVRANKAEQAEINLKQAVYNGTNTAAIQCIQSNIAALQAVTKTYIPSSNICQSDCCGCSVMQ